MRVKFLVIIAIAVDCLNASMPWHTSFPTVGLQHISSKNYPFLPHFFTLHQLAPNQGNTIKLIMVDTGLDEFHYNHMLNTVLKTQPSLDPKNFNSFICDTTDKPFISFKDIPLSVKSLHKASHATHLYSLITGKYGIAPKATCIVLKTFSCQGISSQKNLFNALTTAKKTDPHILLIGLKFHDLCNPESPLAQTINNHLNSFPYVITAAGNDGATCQQLAYPARFTSTTFSVGAFSYKHNTCSVAPFSQTEAFVGPSFLLPGVHIQGAFISPSTNKHDSIYYDSMSGTSCAAALYAGYLALVLGEFKEHFTKEQLTKVLERSCVYPDASTHWKDSSLYGVPDMRLGLFLMHLLHYLAQSLKNFSSHFDFILESSYRYLIHMTDSSHFASTSTTAELATSLPCFNQNFMSYFSTSTSQFMLGVRHPYLAEFSRIFTATQHNTHTLTKAIEYCAAALIPHLRTHLAETDSFSHERTQRKRES